MKIITYLPQDMSASRAPTAAAAIAIAAAAVATILVHSR